MAIYNETLTGGVNVKDCTATRADILSGKTAGVGKEIITGTMPNNGSVSNSIANGRLKQGYTQGGAIPNLTAGNIKYGVNIGGVTGNYKGAIRIDSCEQMWVSITEEDSEVRSLSLSRSCSFVTFTADGMFNAHFIVNKENPSDFTIMKIVYNDSKHQDEEVIIGKFNVVYEHASGTYEHVYKGIITRTAYSSYDTHINMAFNRDFSSIRFTAPTYQEPYSGGYTELYIQAIY